jgi:hypothetical protein
LKDLEERYGGHIAPYAVIKRSGLAEDAVLLRSAGGHANHRARPNARFGVNNGNMVTLKANCNIYHGQEIFLNYNRLLYTVYYILYTTTEPREPDTASMSLASRIQLDVSG